MIGCSKPHLGKTTVRWLRSESLLCVSNRLSEPKQPRESNIQEKSNFACLERF